METSDAPDEIATALTLGEAGNYNSIHEPCALVKRWSDVHKRAWSVNARTAVAQMLRGAGLIVLLMAGGLATAAPDEAKLVKASGYPIGTPENY